MSGSGRSKPSAIMQIGFFACFHGISLERSHFRLFLRQDLNKFKALSFFLPSLSRMVIFADGKAPTLMLGSELVKAIWNISAVSKVSSSIVVTFSQRASSDVNVNTLSNGM